ncbi:proline/betaine transporter [Rickettsia asembonensis]|nr:proline/betaine transporter [Rickettsia asembonensis]
MLPRGLSTVSSKTTNIFNWTPWSSHGVTNHFFY